MSTPQDSRGGSVPPRPPAGKPQQWFVLRPWVFDVTLAGVLLRAAPRPPVPIPVADWARAYGLARDPAIGRHAISLIGPGPDFNPDYAMTTDPDKPVILATLTGSGGELVWAAADRRLCTTGHCPQQGRSGALVGPGAGPARRLQHIRQGCADRLGRWEVGDDRAGRMRVCPRRSSPDGRLGPGTHECFYLGVPDYDAASAPPFPWLWPAWAGIRKFQAQCGDLAVAAEDYFPDCPAGCESQRDIRHGVAAELPGGRGIYAFEAADGVRGLRPRAREPLVQAHLSA